MLGLCFISGIDSRKLMMSFAGELRKSVQLGTSCNAECQHIADRLLARDAALVPLRSASTWRAYRGRNASSCVQLDYPYPPPSVADSGGAPG